jgi:membrane protease YdiL (CAAX protease family)
VAFGWAWLFWSVPVLATKGLVTLPSALRFPVLVTGACGPLVAAFVALYRDGGWRAIRAFASRSLRWRIGPLYLGASLFLVPVLAALATELHAHQAGGRFAFAMPLTHIPASFLLLFFLGGSVEEEFGWAYAIDGMQERWRLLPATLGLGVVWGLWHLPLFFIAGLSQSYTPFWAFLIVTISLRTMYVWAYESSAKSILASLLFHTSANLAFNLFVLVDRASNRQPVYVSFAILCAIAAAVLAFTGTCFRPGSRTANAELRRRGDSPRTLR